MKYSKPPLSITDQIAKLKQRGLKFSNEQKAAHYLSNYQLLSFKGIHVPISG